MKKYSKYALLMLVPALQISAEAAESTWPANAQPASPVANAPAMRASATDPTGDNFNPGPDLTGISADTDGTNLTVTLDFAAMIEPPPGSGGGIEVIGFVDLDVDQDGLTGLSGGNVGVFCPMPPANFGADFVLNLGSYDAMTGLVDVEDSTATVVGTATATFSATSITLVVANATLGGDDGIANINTVIGNIAAPTDCAPDGAVLTSTVAGGGIVLPPPAQVPALNSWGIAVLALLAGLGGLFMRRRQSA